MDKKKTNIQAPSILLPRTGRLITSTSENMDTPQPRPTAPSELVSISETRKLGSSGTGRRLIIQANPIRFQNYNRPQGWLCDLPACHGLFRYALMAKSSYEQMVDTIQVEGDTTDEMHRYNFRQLMSSVAMIQGVAPEEMIKHWRCVDMLFTLTLGLKQVPKIELLRQDKVPELKTQ